MTRRLQILVDDARYRRLEQIAKRRHASVATVVRDALDRTYGLDGTDPAEAAQRFLARPPLELGDWPDAKREVEDAYGRGFDQ
jgi:hypothetical protein